LDKIVRIEKMMLKNLGYNKDGDGILDKVKKIVKNSNERGLLM
jgi:hypothetical protein